MKTFHKHCFFKAKKKKFYTIKKSTVNQLTIFNIYSDASSKGKLILEKNDAIF